MKVTGFERRSRGRWKGMSLRVSPILAALAGALALGACATDDLSLPDDPRARNTGAFPTFAATPAVATRQLPQSEVDRTVRRLEGAEADALAEPRPVMVRERIDRLDAAGRRAASSPAPSDDTARLRRIGETHEAETIRRIEER